MVFVIPPTPECLNQICFAVNARRQFIRQGLQEGIGANNAGALENE